MTMIGLGSQRLEEEVARKLPQARLRRIDSDSMAGRDYYSVLKDFAEDGLIFWRARRCWPKDCTFPT